jgi:hypothetical protein
LERQTALDWAELPAMLMEKVLVTLSDYLLAKVLEWVSLEF